MRDPIGHPGTTIFRRKIASRNIRVAGRCKHRYICQPRSHTMTDQSPAYHYTVIARALRVIDDAGPGLSLEGLAKEMNMSPHHFQRTFSQWVGVSPKRYQQYLALDHARHMLTQQTPLLQTALSTGLSGTGRLHDLFITWEGMSPGDYARGAQGLTIFWGWFDSPFGPALVMGTERGLCGIGFAAEAGIDHTFADLLSRWPNATFIEDPTQLRPLADAAFGNNPTQIHLIGAPFQIKVWEALLNIPTGHVTTYGTLAAAIGHTNASRAVGTAVGRNPIAFLIPCHRVLRKSGQLGGYHWGLPVKRAMLAWESARVEANAQ
jgi:AraC family transcriptional regulator, regulatory protein of adaptative response / methylated-DNA-[protein]-cysteine methyltransferase